MKDASPVPLLDVTNLPTPRKFLDTSQYSTPGSSSGKCLILQPLNCFEMGCSSWAGARVGIPFEQHCWFSPAGTLSYSPHTRALTAGSCRHLTGVGCWCGFKMARSALASISVPLCQLLVNRRCWFLHPEASWLLQRQSTARCVHVCLADPQPKSSSVF